MDSFYKKATFKIIKKVLYKCGYLTHSLYIYIVIKNRKCPTELLIKMS